MSTVALGEAVKWRIGPAFPENEDFVVALWKSCDLIAPYNNPQADFRIAVDGSSSTVLVATAVAGGSTLGSVMVGHDGHRGWLYYVATAPEFRGKGLGRALVLAGEDWLKTREILKAQLLVRETNTAVISFYEGLGYEVAPRSAMGKWLR